MNQHASNSAAMTPPWISPRRAGSGRLRTSPYHGGHVEPEPVEHSVPAVIRPASSQVPQLTCRGLYKSYRKADLQIPVLNGVELDVHEGEFLAIVGQSGSGKSTIGRLVTGVEPLERLPALFDQLKQGSEAMKILVDCQT